jgi:hypothetical protein
MRFFTLLQRQVFSFRSNFSQMYKFVPTSGVLFNFDTVNLNIICISRNTKTQKLMYTYDIQELDERRTAPRNTAQNGQNPVYDKGGKCPLTENLPDTYSRRDVY